MMAMDARTKGKIEREYEQRREAISKMDNETLIREAIAEYEWRIPALEAWLDSAIRSVNNVVQRLDDHKQHLDAFRSLAKSKAMDAGMELFRIDAEKLLLNKDTPEGGMGVYKSKPYSKIIMQKKEGQRDVVRYER